ncbi:hypothetical protein PLICRDRAFT_378930 [Plicaturopsis crispa FD-325 SS-3]|nr:hypothetical protein PLICRDRAFT_378930 [Plicaturopsis crispa FD-325 SS-3]
MLNFILLALALSSSSALGAPADADAGAWCPSHVSAETAAAVQQEFMQKLNGTTRTGDLAAQATTFKVYFNVITSGATGAVSDATIAAQMAQLNSDFNKDAQVNFIYSAAETVRVDNADWHAHADQDNAQEAAMKQALRRGDATSLNVYTVGFNDDPGLQGYATFPWNYADAPTNDGIVMFYGALPGGISEFNTGKVLTHETGHWTGLYHTFQGGCDEAGGDFVPDTPAESSPAQGCPVGRDTCTTPGVDPINNHMDYSNDQCRQSFTPNQVQRLTQMLTTYRGPHF